MIINYRKLEVWLKKLRSNTNIKCKHKNELLYILNFKLNKTFT